jgi:hypothetical protein
MLFPKTGIDEYRHCNVLLMVMSLKDWLILLVMLVISASMMYDTLLLDITIPVMVVSFGCICNSV